jgi:hypothetical protein
MKDHELHKSSGASWFCSCNAGRQAHGCYVTVSYDNDADYFAHWKICEYYYKLDITDRIFEALETYGQHKISRSFGSPK